MPTFLYIGTDRDGYVCMGAKKAGSEIELGAYFDQRGISEPSFFETATNTQRGMYTLINHAELASFCDKFSTLCASEMPLIEIVQLMAYQSKNRTLKAALNEIYDMMDAGFDLSQAITLYSHIFPAKLIYMTIIGEQSGSLDEVFESLSEHYEKQAELLAKLRLSVVPQAILCMLATIVIAFLMFFAMPILRAAIDDTGLLLSGAAQFMMNFSGFVGSVAIIVSLAVLALAFVIRRYLRSRKSANSVWLSDFKLNGVFTKYIYRRVLSVRIANALAILLRSGTGLVNAMEVVAPLVENDAAQERFIQATHDIRAGKDIGEALEPVGIFSDGFIRLAAIGDRSNTLDEMLDMASEMADREASEACERAISVIEPALIITLAFVVFVMILGIMLPIAGLMSAIG